MMKAAAMPSGGSQLHARGWHVTIAIDAMEDATAIGATANPDTPRHFIESFVFAPASKHMIDGTNSMVPATVP